MASTLTNTGALVTKPRLVECRRARRVSVNAEPEATKVAKVIKGSPLYSLQAALQVDRSKDFLFFADENSLSYLDGTFPGDQGFDPLGLCAPGSADVGFINPSWLRYAEIMNGRFAMLGVTGCITPEVLGKLGVIPQETAVVWWKVGLFPFAGQDYTFWADPYTLFFIMIVLMQFAELRRLQDYRKPGSMGKQYFLGFEKALGGSGDPAYPGGLFNPFGMGKDPKSMNDLKLKEVKNGRLAMMAIFGFGAQAVITHKGPVENLLDHIADPFGQNLLTNFGRIYGE